MKQDIEIRLFELRKIIQNLNENMDVIEFIVIDLQPEKFNYRNNKFLMWLWRAAFSQQIISFYHLIRPDEKHSFYKILNLLEQAKIKIDYIALREMVSKATNEYSKNKFETIRSKYVAHKDINVEQIETKMRSINDFTKSLLEIYTFLLRELEQSPKNNIDVKLSMREIFSHINEYENLLRYINYETKKGRKTLSITDMIKFSTL